MTFRSYRREVRAEMERAEQRALEKIGLYVDGEAVSRSPVVSGRLKSSWEHEVQEKSVIVANNTEYAAFVEFGTSRQRAQRILTGSVEENVEEIKGITERELHGVGD